jgi:phospholipase/lecithinase/hemolysin
VVFGDSLSDTGNFYAATGGVITGPPYFPGHFSNGPVWVEVMSNKLGLTAPTPSLLGGTNYAWGGAETGGGLSPVFGIPNVGQQIDSFLSDHGSLARKELVVVWAGANDIVWHATASPAGIVENLSNDLSRLAAAGGKTFLLPNLPAFGEVPLFHGTPDEVRIDTQVDQVNQLLDATVKNLEQRLGIKIIRPDVAGLVDEMLHQPQDFGLTNVTDPACPGCGIGNPSPNAAGTMVPNPSEYLWWDYLHWTKGVHANVGNLVAQVVAEDDSNASAIQEFVVSAAGALEHAGAFPTMAVFSAVSSETKATADHASAMPYRLEHLGNAVSIAQSLPRSLAKARAARVLDHVFAEWSSHLAMPLLS